MIICVVLKYAINFTHNMEVYILHADNMDGDDWLTNFTNNLLLTFILSLRFLYENERYVVSKVTAESGA